MKTARPLVFCSSCLGFRKCRWNGVTVPNEFVERLQKHADLVDNCPEVEIGLGVPRKPVRIISVKGRKSLVQPDTRSDFTSKMNSYIDRLLPKLKDVDGFILKSRSPSCGIRDVKVYPGMEKSGAISAREPGFFGGRLAEQYPLKIIEDEARLRNCRLREHFLTVVFASANFRKARESSDIRELLEFHSINKFLLMSYNQKELKELGRIVACAKDNSDAFRDYEAHLSAAFSGVPRTSSVCNAFYRMYGHFSKKLGKDESRIFNESMGKLRENRIPIGQVAESISSMAARFGDSYIRDQTMLEPYPQDFISVCYPEIRQR